jgi:hypothetical protein
MFARNQPMTLYIVEEGGKLGDGERYLLKSVSTGLVWLTLSVSERISVNTNTMPRNHSNHIYRQPRTGDTVIVKGRDITCSSQTLPWWLG